MRSTENSWKRNSFLFKANFLKIRWGAEAQWWNLVRNDVLKLELKTVLWAGFDGFALNFRVYCKLSFFLLSCSGGSFASTHKLEAGDVLKAPRHNLDSRLLGYLLSIQPTADLALCLSCGCSKKRRLTNSHFIEYHPDTPPITARCVPCTQHSANQHTDHAHITRTLHQSQHAGYAAQSKKYQAVSRDL